MDWSFELEGWEPESPGMTCRIVMSLDVDGPTFDGPATAVAGVDPEALCSPSGIIGCLACSFPPHMNVMMMNIIVLKRNETTKSGDRKSTRLNSSHSSPSRMPSSA